MYSEQEEMAKLAEKFVNVHPAGRKLVAEKLEQQRNDFADYLDSLVSATIEEWKQVKDTPAGEETSSATEDELGFLALSLSVIAEEVRSGKAV